MVTLVTVVVRAVVLVLSFVWLLALLLATFLTFFVVADFGVARSILAKFVVRFGAIVILYSVVVITVDACWFVIVFTFVVISFVCDVLFVAQIDQGDRRSDAVRVW